MKIHLYIGILCLTLPKYPSAGIANLILITMKNIFKSIFGGDRAPKSVTGCVVDAATEEPLIGVKVSAGADYVTFTDFDGNFELTVPAQVKFIEFYYPGCKGKSVACRGGKLNVALEMQ